ncbi:MAG: AAA family ATPase [Chitinivibrionales bacterium]|nr:AAA family ATPase [Chitinivibrionales bacterium]
MEWNNKQVIAIGGGKGGVGKSCFAANLAVLLAEQGKSVLLVDADFGAANLHTILGIKYAQKTLDDFISGRCDNLQDVVLQTPFPNLRLLSSANDIIAIDVPNYSDRLKLYKGIDKIDADIVIFDISAGSHTRALDFFTLAPIGIIILEPTPTSIENAFAFSKNMIFRTLLRLFYQNKELKNYLIRVSDPRSHGKYVPLSEVIAELELKEPKKIRQFNKIFDPENLKLYIVVNRIRNANQKNITDNFARIVKRYLTITVSVLDPLPFDPNMDSAIVNRTPLVAQFPDCGYSQIMSKIIDTLPL